MHVSSKTNWATAMAALSTNENYDPKVASRMVILARFAVDEQLEDDESSLLSDISNLSTTST